MVLEKKNVLFERDEKGELIPQEVKLFIDENDERQLKYKDETIMAIPIPRGKIKRLFSEILDKDEDKDVDSQIILEHCVNPKFDAEEVKAIKPPFSTIIVDTIFMISGIENKQKTRRANVNEAEDEFAKN